MMRPGLVLFIALWSFPAAAQEIDAATRAAVLETAAAKLEATYVFPEIGERVARALRQDARADRFANTDGEAFAKDVTARLRQLSSDGHLGLNYSSTPIVDESSEAVAAYEQAHALQRYGPQLNHGFQKIERIDPNIAYLDLTVFAPPAMAGDVAAAAMTLVAQADALIIDLRDNGGGDGDMVQLVAAYLFDDGTKPMSGYEDRLEDRLTPSMTPAWVPGRRFGGQKPVYILISHKTFSAAEAFAYDLKALGRATIVGEPSGGGAHPFNYERVGLHFTLNIVQGRSLNPLTGNNWQGIGVQPDILVDPEQALEKVLELLRAATKAKSPRDAKPADR